MNDEIKVRVAVIGMGGRAGIVRWLVENREYFSITAGYDPDTERAAEALKNWGSSKSQICRGNEGLESAVVALGIEEAKDLGEVLDVEPIWKRLNR
jgi:predicted dehydrogenase